MQLIADSGSTKTSWRLIKNDNDILNAYTIGYNPHYFTIEKMGESLIANLLPQLNVSTDAIKSIYFYGAGCSTPQDSKRVHKALSDLFATADVMVDHDLLGAARGLCGHQPGIACIIGTGSNSCVFDGKVITDNVCALGFALGDEASGGAIGRKLIQAYFYREMPSELKAAFDEKYTITKAELFDRVYRHPLPNRYMAHFSMFCSDHKEHPFIKNLLHQSFDEFLTRHILKYKEAKEYPIHFLGSIAFYFNDVLKPLMESKGLTLGKIIRGPIDELVKYHLGKI